MKKFALMLASALLVLSAASAMAAVPSKTTTDVTHVKYRLHMIPFSTEQCMIFFCQLLILVYAFLNFRRKTISQFFPLFDIKLVQPRIQIHF